MNNILVFIQFSFESLQVLVGIFKIVSGFVHKIYAMQLSAIAVSHPLYMKFVTHECNEILL